MNLRSLPGALLLGLTLMNNDPALAHDLQHVEPPSWWVGMRDPGLQLMLHGQQLAALQPELVPQPGVSLRAVRRVDNPNYLFLDLLLSPEARPGTIELLFKAEGRTVLTHHYPLRARTPGSAERQGFGPKDAIYLVVPDRFAQGDPGLSERAGMKERIDRGDPSGRHGGDLAGLTAHLDYIAGLGFTQLWPTPLTVNDSARYSYHGYASSDFYRIDPRFGSDADYLQLASEARVRGIGLIQDIVLNHIGSSHWWMKDLPTPDWINQWPGYTETHHARVTVQDPNAAPSDRRRFTDGWFAPHMPDLNQRQPLLATYLTQMSLWWIEHAGLSGLRTDTYSYSDKDFLARWSARLMQEYPRLNIVGEEWSPHPAVVAYWQRGKVNHDGYVSQTPGMMDFPLYNALLAALKEAEGADGGLFRLYEALAHDFVYADPAQLVLFDGNHDTPRLFSVLEEDAALSRIALTVLATTRRIPQFFYGTELLMRSPKVRDDGAVRADFPGGWAGDAVNAFTGQGLSTEQREAQAFVRRLFMWRKAATAVHEGRLMHYAPLDGCYVYFRYTDRQKLMVVLNKNGSPRELDTSRFSEMLTPNSRGMDVLGGQSLPLGRSLNVPARTALIFEVSD